jgi:hypothetical protein
MGTVIGKSVFGAATMALLPWTRSRFTLLPAATVSARPAAGSVNLASVLSATLFGSCSAVRLATSMVGVLGWVAALS